MKYHIPFDIVLSKTSPLNSSLVVGRLDEAELSIVGGAAEVRMGRSARGRKLNKRILQRDSLEQKCLCRI